MNNICNICSNNCRGYNNNHGDCCSANNGEWILGPHQPDDVSEFLSKLGNEIKYEDVFIDYEEGHKLFSNRPWQRPEAYPALRVNMNNEKKFCMFYNEIERKCSVYDIRPKICQNYFCSFLKNSLETKK